MALAVSCIIGVVMGIPSQFAWVIHSVKIRRNNGFARLRLLMSSNSDSFLEIMSFSSSISVI